MPLRTLDPAEPLDDLEWLDETIGDARVVAIGESAHYNREFFQLRHRLLRYLVERHGFSAYAMETGFVEGWLTDDWVRGGEGPLGQVMANGMTSLMGLWTQMRDQLEWMRRHNGTAAHPVGFYGIDMPGMPPATPMGMHLADRLGKDYLVIGATSGTGQILNTGPDFYGGTLFTDMAEAPQPGSLDALMAASHDGPFAVDLRRLSPTDASTLRAVSRQRFGMGTFYSAQSPPDAYDLVVHLPHVPPADPDDDALAAAPHDVREPFSQWKRP